MNKRNIFIFTAMLLVALSLILSGCNIVSSKPDIPSVDDVKAATQNAKPKPATANASANTAPKVDENASEEDKKQFMDAFVDSPAHEWMILRHAAGKIKIGDTKEAVYENYPKDSLKYLEPKDDVRKTGAIEVYSGGEVALLAEFDTEKTPTVWRIKVFDFRLKTSDGIHVGSKVSDLKKVYDDLEYNVSNGTAVARSMSVSMGFVLDSAGLTPAWKKNPKSETAPDDAEIIEILVL